MNSFTKVTKEKNITNETVIFFQNFQKDRFDVVQEDFLSCK